MTSKIQWTDETWNPVTGCSKISPGCQNCYAERMSKRLAGRFGYPKDDPFKITDHLDKLRQPLKWKKPRRIFVCSMGDLFHEKVDFYQKARIMSIMGEATQHTYILLTKRPHFAKQFFERHEVLNYLPNMWLGVTAENQEQADKRIPILLQIPAKVRFVSVEPMLSHIDINKYLPKVHPDGGLLFSYREGKQPYISWVICGGENSPNARPMHPDWARSLRDQCQNAGVPFFFKQWGEWLPFDQRKAGQLSNSASLKSNGFAWKTGKKIAGRNLDYRTWNEFPE